MLKRLCLLLVLCTLPDWVLAADIYVRPADDGNGNALTYGTGDGTSYANAIAGFTTINSGAKVIAPGDRICLSDGEDEIYYERFLLGNVHGTEADPITMEGCGATRAVFWSAAEISGDRSFNVSKVAVNGAAYEWVDKGNDIWMKRVDRKLLMLWEDTTKLTPLLLWSESEAAILATLQPGEWGNKDNGDTTVRVYYRATVPGKSPTNTTIRCNYVPLDANAMNNVVKDWYILRNFEVRGHTSLLNQHPLIIQNADHFTMENVWFMDNANGPVIKCVTNGLDIGHYLIKDVEVWRSEGTGFQNRGTASTCIIRNVTYDGGHYNGSMSHRYTGDGFFGGDGDGLAWGFEGGNQFDTVVKNVTANDNQNYGVFSGTNTPYNHTNFTVQSSTFDGNKRGCFAEGTDAEISGTLRLSGILCLNSGGWASALDVFTGDINIEWGTPTDRNIILENIVIAGSTNETRLIMLEDAKNHYFVRNLVFINNPGNTAPGFADQGDIWTDGSAFTIAQNLEGIYFYSAPNQARRFFKFNAAATSYGYNSAGDQTAWVTATGATNVVFNVDPLFVSASDFHTQAGSPLRNAATFYSTCIGVDGTVCDADPDIGAWQTSLSPAPAAPTGLHFVGAASNNRAVLVWPPNSETDLTGYKVYMGTATGQTTLIATITLAGAAASHHPPTQYSVKLRQACTCYFTVTAYRTTGGETTVSDKSNEISRTFAPVGRTARQ